MARSLKQIAGELDAAQDAIESIVRLMASELAKMANVPTTATEPGSQIALSKPDGTPLDLRAIAEELRQLAGE